MSNRFANGSKAIAECDVCGFRFKLKELKNLVVKTKQVSIKACRQCWSKDHPQLLLGTFPIADPQAIRDPRPDRAGYYGTGGSRIFQWGWAPVGGSRSFDAPLTPNALSAQGVVGTVTVV